MGYTTEFFGRITIDPPLNAKEINYINKFSDTRRMNRFNGPYFVDGTGMCGQGSDSDIIDYNSPDPSQPSLWCQWVVDEDEGMYITWNEAEKFYYSEVWMRYIIDHFLKPGALAAKELPFLQCNHICNGTILAEGEYSDDVWNLIVRDNVVTSKVVK